MPFNGAGVFNRLYSWTADAAAGIKILAARMDVETGGIASGLTNCVTRDGQSPPLADLPMGGFGLTALRDASANQEPLTFGQVAASTGSSLVGRRRDFTGSITQTLDADLNAAPVKATEAMTTAQQTAIRTPSATTGIAEAINATLTYAGTLGGTGVLPAGLYDCRVPVVIPPLGSIRGETVSFPSPTYDPGFTFRNGTVLAKKHTGNAITLDGGSAYAVCGSIENIAISSDRTAYAGGNGLVVNNCGSLRIREVRAFGIGGDSFVFGTSVGDVTGQIHAEGLYSNSPTGKSIKNRSRWIKLTKVETDGGTHGYYADNASDGSVIQFHFEGATTIAVEFVNASKNHKMLHGFVGLTDVAATHGFKLNSTAGNTDLTFDKIQLVGHSAATGAEIQASCWRTRWNDICIESCQVGILDLAHQTSISGNTKFLVCALPIRTAGDGIMVDGAIFDGTTGNYAIEFTAPGAGGHIIGCQTDKPFRPAAVAITFTSALSATTSATLTGAWAGLTGPYTITFSDNTTKTVTLTNGSTGVTWSGAVTATAAASARNLFGDFGSTVIRDNPGFKTRGAGKTASVATGVVIPHGLAVTPYVTNVWSASALPADFAWTWDGTNITATWTGGGLLRASVERRFPV